jgi:TIR domain-containing protein
MAPLNAFLCHASEDKETYVKPFAVYLANKGVNPWVDQWEIGLGDSFLSKIQSGITAADFFLPFVTPRSVDRPWVNAEIEMAVTRKMVDKLRIIPVVVDLEFSAIPLFLQTIKGVKLNGPADISRGAQEVVDSIYGLSAKPVVAPRPAYDAVPAVSGLSPADVSFLKAACEHTIVADQRHIAFENVALRLEGSGMAPQTMKDSLDVLSENGYLKRDGVVGDPYKFVKVLPTGFDLYASLFVEDYGDIYKRIAATIATEARAQAKTIAADMKLPLRLVNHVYEHLEMRGKITLSKTISPSHSAASVSPTFRREMTGA